MFTKRFMTGVLTLALVLSLSACNGDGMKVNTSDINSSSSQAEVETGFVPMYSEYDLSDYLKLGEYKNLEVDVDNSPITDENVDDFIKSQLIGFAESNVLDKGAVQNEDFAVIDFTGYIDGETFDGGSATGYTLQIGAGGMIKGFEEGLVGKNIGEEVTLDLKFPDEYPNNPDLAGKPVVFKITVQSVTRYKFPELTDEFVKEKFKYDTVAEFKTETRKYLEETKESSLESNKMGALYNKILETTQVKDLPKGEVSYYATQVYDMYSMVAANAGYEFEDYIKNVLGTTLEQFVSTCEKEAKAQVQNDLVAVAILKAEGIEITDEMYYEKLEEYVKTDGVTDVETLEKNSTNKSLSVRVIRDYAMEAIMKTAKINLVTSKDDGASSTASDASSDPASEPTSEPASGTTSDVSSKADEGSSGTSSKE